MRRIHDSVVAYDTVTRDPMGSSGVDATSTA